MTFTIGSRAESAIDLYFLDPAHEGEPYLDGRRLTVVDPIEAMRRLTEAANSADAVAEGAGGHDAFERAQSRLDRTAFERLVTRIAKQTRAC